MGVAGLSLILLAGAQAGCGDSGNGVTCGAGLALANGVCVPLGAGPATCAAGMTMVNNVCTVEATLASSTCGTGSTFTNGSCVVASPIACGAGQTMTNGVCVATTPVLCGPGTWADNGACVTGPTLTCGSGTKLMDGTCIPSALACGPNDTLVNGVCQPPVPVTCGDHTMLVDTHCVGETPNACGTGTTLVNGVCEAPPLLTCGGGATLVNNTCVAQIACDPATTQLNGACVLDPATLCGANTALVSGNCVASGVVTCGAGTVANNGACEVLPPVTCGPGTTLNNGVCDPPLQPGQFESPALHLMDLIGSGQHLHIDEVRYRASDQKILQCSYTFGVINAADPANLSYLVDQKRYAFPGDPRTNAGCLHLAWDEAHPNTIFVTHHGNITNAPPYLGGWNLSTTSPMTATQITGTLQEPGTSYEDIEVAGGYIYVSLHERGVGVYTYDYTSSVFTRVGGNTDVTNAWGLTINGSMMYIGDTENGVATFDISNPTTPVMLAEVGVGGVARGLVANGNTLYVAAGGAGLVIMDVSNPSSPTILSTVPTPGAAIRVAYNNNIAYVAAWNDVRAYDVTDPANPRFITAIREVQQATYGSAVGDLDIGRPPVTVRNLGVTAWGDDFVMPGNWWILHSYKVKRDVLAPAIRIPEAQNEMDFGQLAVGASLSQPYVVYNDGPEPLTLSNLWIEHATSFSVTPTSMRIPPGGQGTLTVTMTPTIPDEDWGILHVNSDDPMWPARTSVMIGNRSGPAVGAPMPLTTVNLIDGTQVNTQQFLGKVLVVAYFATF